MAKENRSVKVELPTWKPGVDAQLFQRKSGRHVDRKKRANKNFTPIVEGAKKYK